ncbi:NAD(P)/FAD-dependent oxidoreductase [Niabella insulamsoli]|uniref:phytoene desaturase family protein n=1 Tax=Niabella insulamsoli TaxID=3144874 RepID=UPI0031FC270D
MSIDKKYDVVIIGSGLGGLLCANMLGMAGLKVCVLEKNRQLGGNLQTFSRDKKIFDTGVHYIGGLAQGQTLYQIFEYVGIMKRLKLEKMDRCFDKIFIGNDPKLYGQVQGYDAFVRRLSADFPGEEHNIRAYVQKVQQVCNSFPLYNLSLNNEEGETYLGNNESAEQVIASFTANKKLRAVLAGNNLLYAGTQDVTPFHVHALITNSYIESSWRCINGGSQIARLLAINIRKYGGDILRNTEIVALKEMEGAISYAQTSNGDQIFGKRFISNIHPAATLSLTKAPQVSKLYRKRITGLKQTISSLSVYLVLKPKQVAYEKSNYYYHKEGKLWHLNDYDEQTWPLGYGLYFTEDRANEGFAAAISILTPMRFEDVRQWSSTYNRTGKEQWRGASYDLFKQQKAEQLLRLVGERLPHIVNNIEKFYVATPLTNRDYIGDAEGSMYGVQKDYRDPLQTMISPRTKIPNLFLTGQNLNLHGILGTALSAVLTCTMLLDDNSLVEKIKKA